MLRVRKANQEVTLRCPFDEDVSITFISAMDYDSRSVLYDFMQSLGTDKKNKDAMKFYREVCKKCLKDVTGVLNEDATPLIINGQGATDVIMDALQEVLLPASGFDNLLSWAGSEIWNANALSDKTKKNSEQSSQDLETNSDQSSSTEMPTLKRTLME